MKQFGYEIEGMPTTGNGKSRVSLELFEQVLADLAARGVQAPVLTTPVEAEVLPVAVAGAEPSDLDQVILEGRMGEIDWAGGDRS
jgi:hypothetical protein